jgi:Xaa-Pro dipeptidase
MTTTSPGPDPTVAPLDGTPPPAWLDTEHVAAVRTAEPNSFSDHEYTDRLARVRARLAEHDATAILVFKPSSVEYLCGYHSAETAPQPLLVTETDQFLYILDLELARALASSRAGTILYSSYATMDRILELVARHVASALPKQARLVVESSQPTTPPKILGLLHDAGVSVRDGDFLVERARLTLSRAEIACVEQAAAVTQRGVEAAVAAASTGGATDSSVAAAIADALFRDADSRSAWGPVVATGARGGIAHSSWINTPLAGDVTFLEFAGTHRRYHAPIMRTLTRGPVSTLARRLESLAQAALDAVLNTAKPGVPCAEVAHAAIDAIGPLRADEVSHFMFGYPVGLAHPPHWMDGAPFYITTANQAPLQAGMTFHMPGSFRSFGNCGVGLSHTFTVEDAGTRVLTHGAANIIIV